MRLYHERVILITGAAGMIGSGVVRYLNDIGYHNLVLIDQLDTSDKWKNLVGKRFIELLEKDQLFDWLKGRETNIEGIIHLGACSSTTETDASYLLQNNTRYSMRLAEYALRHEIRFVYASSAATYGDGREGFSDDHRKLQSLRPLNMYGFSKHMFDLWLQEQGALDEVVGLKYFNVFGPNEYHKERMASAVLKMLPQAQSEEMVRLFMSDDPDAFADGDQKRDFIYVKDAARMTVEFLLNTACGIFNVGTGVANTWNTLATSLFKAIDLPANIEYVEMPQDLVGKYQNFTEADMAKTRKALGSGAKTMGLEDAVVQYVRDYLLQDARW